MAENDLGGEKLTHKYDDKTACRQCKAGHNGGFHGLRIPADQRRQRDHQHHQVHDRIGDAAVLLQGQFGHVRLAYPGMVFKFRKLTQAQQ